ADYLRLNPTGRVPTLVERDGREERAVVFQSAAILLYLGDRHPDAGFLGPAGSPARARAYQWMWFMAEQLQPAYLMHFHPDNYTADAAGMAAVDRKASDMIDAAWALLDDAIGRAPYFHGTAPGVCDYYMLTFALWHKASHPPLARHGHLAAALRALVRRPAVARMMAASEKTLDL
ncbi:MAG: glutathione S-transferase family protein, partial [Alphaproteobacteria bacterium]|nr:glutathione S-transferase family protein [Alphaproteobacteria bacterium]